MTGSLLTVALCVTFGTGPFGYGGTGCTTCGTAGGNFGNGGYSAGGYADGGYGGGVVYGGSMGSAGAYGDQLYPFDSAEPWLHGYFQEISPYAGYHKFRPYNYKHVLSQSQAAAGWGIAANMPYSQQWWHRYEQRARMRKPITQLESSPDGATAAASRWDAAPGLEASQAWTPASGTIAGASPVDPVSYDRRLQIELLQQQLQQQSIRLQEMQNAFPQQSQPTYQQFAPQYQR